MNAGPPGPQKPGRPGLSPWLHDIFNWSCVVTQLIEIKSSRMLNFLKSFPTNFNIRLYFFWCRFNLPNSDLNLQWFAFNQIICVLNECRTARTAKTRCVFMSARYFCLFYMLLSCHTNHWLVVSLHAETDLFCVCSFATFNSLINFVFHQFVLSINPEKENRAWVEIVHEINVCFACLSTLHVVRTSVRWKLIIVIFFLLNIMTGPPGPPGTINQMKRISCNITAEKNCISNEHELVRWQIKSAYLNTLMRWWLQHFSCFDFIMLAFDWF